MRRDSNRRENESIFKNKLLISGGITLLIIIAIVVSIILYAKQLNFDFGSGMSAQKLSSLSRTGEIEDDVIIGESTESASNPIGKTVEESKKENTNTSIINEVTNTNNSTSTNKTTSDLKANKTTTNKATSTSKSSNSKSTKNTSTVEEKKDVEKVVKKEITFIQPVEGDIIKEYAKDNLVYSTTLEEWVTHLGVDIKADKTSVVKSSADGVVRSIKNDPRYGLTVVINHDDEYQTVYANLLTAEFISEGESVKQGQTIGTVGNTAVFEISDDTHLHFEILKDSVQVDPNIYIKGD